jgi:hypothetical protein
MAVAVIIGNIDLSRRLAPRPPLGVIANVPAPAASRPAPPAPPTPRPIKPAPIASPTERAAPPTPLAVAAPVKRAPSRVVAAPYRPRPVAARRVPTSVAPSHPAPSFPSRASTRSTPATRDVTDDEVLPLSFDSPP